MDLSKENNDDYTKKQYDKFSRNMHLLNNNIFNSSRCFNVVRENKIFKLKDYNPRSESVNKDERPRLPNISTRSNYHYCSTDPTLMQPIRNTQIAPNIPNTYNTQNTLNQKAQSVERNPILTKCNDVCYNNGGGAEHSVIVPIDKKGKQNDIEKLSVKRANSAKNLNSNYHIANSLSYYENKHKQSLKDEEKIKSFADYMKQLSLKYISPPNEEKKSQPILYNQNENIERREKHKTPYIANVPPHFQRISIQERKTDQKVKIENEFENRHIKRALSSGPGRNVTETNTYTYAGDYKKKNIFSLEENTKLPKISKEDRDYNEDYYEKSHISFQDSLLKKLEQERQVAKIYQENNLKYEKQKDYEKDTFIEKNVHDKEEEDKENEINEHQRKLNMLRFNNQILEYQIKERNKQEEGTKLKRLISKENLNHSLEIGKYYNKEIRDKEVLIKKYYRDILHNQVINHYENQIKYASGLKSKRRIIRTMENYQSTS